MRKKIMADKLKEAHKKAIGKGTKSYPEFRGWWKPGQRPEFSKENFPKKSKSKPVNNQEQSRM